MKDKMQDFLENRINGGEGFSERQERLFDTNIFLAKMLAAGAVFHLILYIYPNTVPLQALFSDLIAGTMNLFGYSFYSPEVFLLGAGGAAYEITQDCLGWKSMMAFTALMYASPGRTRNNLRFLGAGLALIFLANIVRVVTTVHLAELGVISFGVIHGFLWKWGLTAIVLIAWGYWSFRYQ
ncbi:MAG: exosortase/archaeosortase family protein [Candidatus Nanosalina sp.]